jgi:uncharacterized membrane protein YfcA
MRLFIFCFFTLFLTSLTGIAQLTPKGQDTDQSSIANAPPKDTETPEDISATIAIRSGKDIFHSFEFILSVIVLLFGIIVVFLEVYLAKLKVIKSEHILKCIVITLVIVAALVLITAGYSNNQINGITGILGSIAGYLLGKTDSSPQPEADKQKNI